MGGGEGSEPARRKVTGNAAKFFTPELNFTSPVDTWRASTPFSELLGKGAQRASGMVSTGRKRPSFQGPGGLGSGSTSFTVPEKAA